MAAKLKTLHKKLLDEWGKEKSRNLPVISQTLLEIKVLLSDPAALQELDERAGIVIHRDVLEIDALFSVINNDVESFEEAIEKVNKFYESSDESPNKYHMIGLNLMFLLASNRLSQFHMVLEDVGQELQGGNPYVSTPVKMEQYLMEGAYNKIVLTEKNMPSPFYTIFVNIMLDTVRNEIAQCIEKSFRKIALAEAARMLLFPNSNGVQDYGKKRVWRLENGEFLFEDGQKDTAHEPTRVEADRLIKQNIFYAKQLEMIV